MLVLSRYVGQKVVIDGPATVTVNFIGNNKVRLGFEAQPDVIILRKELVDVEKEGVKNE